MPIPAINQPINLDLELNQIRNQIKQALEQSQWDVVIEWRDMLQPQLDLGRYWDEAILFNEWAITSARNLRNAPLVARYTHDLADMYSQQGHYPQAEVLYQQSYEIFEQENFTHEATKSLHMLSIAKRALGKNTEAEKLAQTCLERARASNMGYWQVQPLHVLAWLNRDKSNFDQALYFLNEALDVYTNTQEHDRIPMLAQCNYDIARTLIMKGDFKPAEQYVEAAISWSGKGKIQRIRDMALKLKGDLAFLQNNISDALLYYNEALDSAEAANDERRVADLHIDLARVHWKMGLRLDAFNYFQIGVSQLRTHKLITVARFRTVLSQLLWRVKRKLLKS